MAHELPELPYSYDALEPFIDSRTMELHHTKHHQAYLDKLNLVLEKYPELAGRDLGELLGQLDSLPMQETDRLALRNNAGGHLNHSFFWSIMSPQKNLDHGLSEQIVAAFGSVEEFKKQFAAAAIGRFGSGWAWLAQDDKKQLSIYSTANQDSPLMQGHQPLIGLDVWEHAYYLKYQNKRAEYVENWWNVLKFL